MTPVPTPASRGAPSAPDPRPASAMRRPRAGGITCLAVLLLLAGASIPAQEIDPLFSEHPSLVSILHIPNLQAADTGVTRFVQTLPGHAPPPPLFAAWLARTLHHADLKGVKPGSPLDILDFNPTLVRDGSRVWVFEPTSSEAFFDALVATQRLREESTTGDITRYFVHDQGYGRHVYLSSQGGRIFFSEGAEGIRRAHAVYANTGSAPLLPGRRETAVLRVHVQRWVVAHQDALRLHLDRIRRDIVFDLEGATPEDGHPTHAMMGAASTLLLYHLRQAVMLDAGLVVDANGVRVHGMLAFQDGEMLHHAMATVPAHRLTLPERLPEGVVSIRGAKVWPAQVSFLFDFVGETLLGGLATAPQDEALDTIRDLRDTFLRHLPHEVATGILPAPEGGGGPLQVGLLRWEDPEGAAAWWERAEAEITGGILSDYLTRNGLKVEIQSTSRTRIGEDTIRRVRMQIRSSAGSLQWPGITGEDRTWFAARQGDTLVLVTTAQPASIERNPLVERTCLLAMQQVLRGLREGERSPLALALHPENVEDILFQLSVNPLAYAREAMQASAAWSRSTDPRSEPDWLSLAREFAEFKADAPPLTLSVRTLDASRRGQGTMQFRVQLPAATVTEFLRAALENLPMQTE